MESTMDMESPTATTEILAVATVADISHSSGDENERNQPGETAVTAEAMLQNPVETVIEPSIDEAVKLSSSPMPGDVAAEPILENLNEVHVDEPTEPGISPVSATLEPSSNTASDDENETADAAAEDNASSENPDFPDVESEPDIEVPHAERVPHGDAWDSPLERPISIQSVKQVALELGNWRQYFSQEELIKGGFDLPTLVDFASVVDYQARLIRQENADNHFDFSMHIFLAQVYLHLISKGKLTQSCADRLIEWFHDNYPNDHDKVITWVDCILDAPHNLRGGAAKHIIRDRPQDVDDVQFGPEGHFPMVLHVNGQPAELRSHFNLLSGSLRNDETLADVAKRVPICMEAYVVGQFHQMTEQGSRTAAKLMTSYEADLKKGPRTQISWHFSQLGSGFLEIHFIIFQGKAHVWARLYLKLDDILQDPEVQVMKPSESPDLDEGIIQSLPDKRACITRLEFSMGAIKIGLQKDKMDELRTNVDHSKAEMNRTAMQHTLDMLRTPGLFALNIVFMAQSHGFVDLAKSMMATVTGCRQISRQADYITKVFSTAPTMKTLSVHSFPATDEEVYKPEPARFSFDNRSQFLMSVGGACILDHRYEENNNRLLAGQEFKMVLLDPGIYMNSSKEPIVYVAAQLREQDANKHVSGVHGPIPGDTVRLELKVKAMCLKTPDENIYSRQRKAEILVKWFMKQASDANRLLKGVKPDQEDREVFYSDFMTNILKDDEADFDIFPLLPVMKERSTVDEDTGQFEPGHKGEDPETYRDRVLKWFEDNLDILALPKWQSEFESISVWATAIDIPGARGMTRQFSRLFQFYPPRVKDWPSEPSPLLQLDATIIPLRDVNNAMDIPQQTAIKATVHVVSSDATVKAQVMSLNHLYKAKTSGMDSGPALLANWWLSFDSVAPIYSLYLVFPHMAAAKSLLSSSVTPEQKEGLAKVHPKVAEICEDCRFNKSQLLAMENASHLEFGILWIQGVPGSGKSTFNRKLCMMAQAQKVMGPAKPDGFVVQSYYDLQAGKPQFRDAFQEDTEVDLDSFVTAQSGKRFTAKAMFVCSRNSEVIDTCKAILKDYQKYFPGRRRVVRLVSLKRVIKRGPAGFIEENIGPLEDPVQFAALSETQLLLHFQYWTGKKLQAQKELESVEYDMFNILKKIIFQGDHPDFVMARSYLESGDQELIETNTRAIKSAIDRAMKELWEQADAIVGTPASFYQFAHKYPDVKFTFASIEEAARMHEGEIASILAYFSPHLRFIVISGDVRQCGPLILSRNAHLQYNASTREKEETWFCNLFGPQLELSPLKRFSRLRPEKVQNFMVNNRQLMTLVDIPSRMFYDSKMLAAAGEGQNVPQICHDFRSMVHVMFPSQKIDTQGAFSAIGNSFFFEISGITETKREDSFINAAHANALMQLACHVAKCNLRHEGKRVNIIIVTMYRAQRDLLVSMKNNLPGGYAKFVDPRTIDEAQGFEGDLVFIDLLRSGNPGHTADERILTTAMTRARFGSIILANTDITSSRRRGPNILKRLRDEHVRLDAVFFLGNEDNWTWQICNFCHLHHRKEKNFRSDCTTRCSACRLRGHDFRSDKCKFFKVDYFRDSSETLTISPGAFTEATWTTVYPYSKVLVSSKKATLPAQLAILPRGNEIPQATKSTTPEKRNFQERITNCVAALVELKVQAPASEATMGALDRAIDIIKEASISKKVPNKAIVTMEATLIKHWGRTITIGDAQQLVLAAQLFKPEASTTGAATDGFVNTASNDNWDAAGKDGNTEGTTEWGPASQNDNSSHAITEWDSAVQNDNFGHATTEWNSATQNDNSGHATTGWD